MAFVISMKGHRSEVGQHNIVLNFVDSDGRPIISRFQGIFHVAPRQINVYFINYLQNITFPGPGDYAVDILVDNRHLGSVPLCVMMRK